MTQRCEPASALTALSQWTLLMNVVGECGYFIYLLKCQNAKQLKSFFQLEYLKNEILPCPVKWFYDWLRAVRFTRLSLSWAVPSPSVLSLPWWIAQDLVICCLCVRCWQSERHPWLNVECHSPGTSPAEWGAASSDMQRFFSFAFQEKNVIRSLTSVQVGKYLVPVIILGFIHLIDLRIC